MTTPVWQLERELDYAKARETYYRTRKPSDSPRVARPMTSAYYQSYLVKVGTANAIVKLQASEEAIAFFTAASLNLVTADADQAKAIPKPRGFQPSLVKAMTGDPSPSKKKAFGGTGRPYVKYSKTTEGSAQAHYQAPLGGDTATADSTITAFNSLKTSIASKLGSYGRLYLQLERYTLSGS